MQNLIYPTKIMNISQSYEGNFSHEISSTGNPKSYPIDDVAGSKNDAYFYAPCDLVVKRVYGVGNNGTNTIWLESVNKVRLANGNESYVTLMIIHPNDKTLSKFKVSQIYKQYDKMFEKGDDGFATGKHFHIEVATTKFENLKNNGWIKNSKGAWVISNKAIKPEQAFFIDTKFTKQVNNNGLKFLQLTKDEINEFYPKVTNKTSIVDALKSINVDSSFENRAQIAEINGINSYEGTSAQNNKLINLLSQGKLKKR